ncbi:MAG: ABC transporter permease [Vicinamibacterales bacterium]
MSWLSYAFEEAWASLGRAGRSAAISVGTIAIAFVALGGFLLVSVNVQRAIDRWLASAELSVYLKDDAPDDQRTALEEYLKAQAVVVAVEFISKERALARFQADFPELTDVATTLADNPFPGSLEVRLRTGAQAADQADTLAKSVSGRPGVADVRYDRRWIERLLALVTGGRVAGAIVAGILMLGAAFTVAAVVRLSLHARRDEIDIMQLVGAPFSFIRGPSVVEGLLLGGAGAAVALLLVWVLYLVISRSVGADAAGVIGEGGLRFLGVTEVMLMLGGGLAVGAAAGALAARAVK